LLTFDDKALIRMLYFENVLKSGLRQNTRKLWC